MPEIEDIIETPERAPLLLGWQWLLLVFLCVIAICAVLAYLKYKKKSFPSANNLKKALKRLKKISQSTGEGDIDSNQLVVELSFITREYLQGQFRNKSIFQTHQEFIADHQDLEKIPDSAREDLSAYLTILAQHKYSPDQHLPAEKNKLIHHTESLIRGIHVAVPKNIK
jgi:hypothetical protein